MSACRNEVDRVSLECLFQSTQALWHTNLCDGHRPPLQERRSFLNLVFGVERAALILRLQAKNRSGDSKG